MSITNKVVISAGEYRMDVWEGDRYQNIECYYYVRYNDSWRKATITVDVKSAKDLIEVLQDYVEYEEAKE